METLLIDRSAGVVTVTLNRPARRNAISEVMWDELLSTFREIAGNVDEDRAVVITGAGGAFCSGADIGGGDGEPQANGMTRMRRIGDVCLALHRLPQPVIAKVHGIATAAGCQLVAACDLAVASDDARFATSGINFGLFCATPGVAVSRDISRKRAFEMLFTGEFVDAPTALAWGLLNRVASRADLDAATQALAQSLLDKPARVVALGKRFFYDQLEERIETAYRIATATITDNMLGDDAQEGVAAFVEKRKPRWDR